MEYYPIPSVERFPVVSSLLSADRLCATTTADYGIAPRQCHLWFAGTTDTYLVTTDQDRYMLRLYDTGTRTDNDIPYELAALEHLHQKGITVAMPIRRRDASWFTIVHAPEGPRQQVLFAYAQGCEAYREDDYAER